MTLGATALGAVELGGATATAVVAIRPGSTPITVKKHARLFTIKRPMETKYHIRRLSPDAILDFPLDWSTIDFIQSGDTITSSTWTIPDGMTGSDDSFTGTSTVIWLSFTTAVLGLTYQVTNHITTAAGRIDDFTFEILCDQE